LQNIDRCLGLPKVQQSNRPLPVINRHKGLEALHFLPDAEFLLGVAEKSEKGRGILYQRVGIIWAEGKRLVEFAAPRFPIVLVDCPLGQGRVRGGIAWIEPQRLVRRICDKCKEPIEVTPEALINLGVDASEAAGGFPTFRGRGGSPRWRRGRRRTA